MTLSRRDFLKRSALAAGAMPGLALAQPSEQHCVPAISGCLRPFGPVWDRDHWARELDDERALGFDLLWLSHLPRTADGAGTIAMVLDLCAERGMGAILSVGSTPRWYAALDAEGELAGAKERIDALANHHGSHPAFHAWYIPHEIYAAWDAFATYIHRLYTGLAAHCRATLPGKPVTVSPFFILDRDRVFGDFRYAEPDEYAAFWTGLLDASGIDIVMLQDSGEHFSYVTNAQRRPFFAAMAAACRNAGATLWGNVETAEFECPSIEAYIARYGRVHHSTVQDAPWRAVPMDRLAEKLSLAAEFSQRIVCWGYYQYGRPHLGPEAAAWYRAYQAYAAEMQAGKGEAAKLTITGN